MDESEESKALTPLGNERRDNPGQTKVFENTDGTDMMPTAPSWDKDTPLEDIASQYTGIGGKYNDLVENAADNVGDRQVQLVGNDFGATNPYMFNTYYEPAATTFASKMRMEGTQAALEEGLDRGETEAKNNLTAAQQRYNNAVAAQRAREEQQRNAKAYVSETDMSKMPEGTTERDLIASEEFKSLSDEEKKQRLTEARIKDVQDTMSAAGTNMDWDIKEERSVATDSTLSQFGMTRDQLNSMSEEERKAFWARKDVGNYWTEQYMLNYFKKRGGDNASVLEDTFRDIHSDVNAIVEAIKTMSVDSLDENTFKSATPVFINAASEAANEKLWSNIHDNVASAGRTVQSSEQIEQAYNAILEGRAFEENGKWYIKSDAPLSGGKVELNQEGLYYYMDGTKYHVYDLAKKLKEADAWDKFANGEYSDLPEIDVFDKKVADQEKTANVIVDSENNKTFMAAFGIDYQSLKAIAELQQNSPEDYEYLLNQAAFVFTDNPVEIVEDENKKYFINGEWKTLSKGDLVFHTIDGTVGADGKFQDKDLEHYVDLYRKIYNGEEEASDENLETLKKYFEAYQSRLFAAMAATGQYGVKVDEDIYGAILNVMTEDGSRSGDKLIFNPDDPNGSKISVNEFKVWWNNLTEDEQYNFYSAVAARARETRGYYYFHDDATGGIRSHYGIKSNGEDLIGKRGKGEGDGSMWAANKVPGFSDEQCLAINMILDFEIKNDGISHNFMDNDEVALTTRFANSFVDAAYGSAQFFGWAGCTIGGWFADIFVDDKDNAAYKKAGEIWDDMTNLTPDDDNYEGDHVLFNDYTMNIRAQQRANLNHLINTTFNIHYFDPDNTIDEATGEVLDKDGNVIAYTDNGYFHYDQVKAGLDTATDILAFVAEFAVEAWLTAGIEKLVGKGLEMAASKIFSKSAAANVMANMLTADLTVSGVKAAHKANEEIVNMSRLQHLLGAKGLYTSKAAKYTGETTIKVIGGTANAASAAGKAVNTGSTIVDDAIRGAAKTETAGEKLLGTTDNIAREAEKGAGLVDDALTHSSSLTDDIAERARSLTDNVVDDAYEGEIQITKGRKTWTSEGLEEQYIRARTLDAVVDAGSASSVDAANTLASYMERALEKTGKTLDSFSPFGGTVEKIRSMLASNALDSMKRAAMNTRVAEAAGVSVQQVSKLSDSTISILYNALRSSEGRSMSNVSSYIAHKVETAGMSIAEGTIDFSRAVNEAIKQTDNLLKKGVKSGLSSDDVVRILATNSTDSNFLLKSMKADAFIKDRLTDWAQDIKMNYYTPYLDEDFNSDYTDISEYVSDPTQWLSGAVFDIGASGLRKIFSSSSLALTNNKINKIMKNIDTSPTSAVDRAKLSKQITKLNSLRVKADGLSNKMLDNHISVTKVTEVRQKATDALDKQMSKITNSFDFEKSLDFMTNNLKDAAEKSTKWDRLKDKTGFFGRSRVAQAQDLNRYLLKSNQSLEAFWTLSQAQQSRAIINFADIKSHTRNMAEIDGNKWARGVSEGFKATQNMSVEQIFGKRYKDVLKNGTINVADKELAKEMVEIGQTVLYNEIYDAMARNVGDITNLPALRSELNWVRDRMIEYSQKAIDNGQKVRWNYFPTQGIMFDGIDSTPMALVGFYYGSGLHPDVSNKMANPNLTRDTWDFAEISQNILDGKDHYTQQIGAVEQIQNAKKGIKDTTKEIPYNMDFFNPAYALQAYSNVFESKQFAAKMLDPMQNGHVVVRSDSVLSGVRATSNSQLNTIQEQKKASLTEEFKKSRADKKKTNIDAIKNDTQKSIASAEKSLVKTTSKKVDNINGKILKEQSRAEKKVVNSDLFKGYARYSGLEGKANSTIAKQMSTDYDQVIKDVAAARKALKANTGATNVTSVKASTMSGMITADVVKANPDKVFLFGDNIADAKTGYVPKSTQAVIRGQENAIGIPTKKNRGTANGSYFTDADFNEFKQGVDAAISSAKKTGKQIVIPEAGIGTGKAQLKERAPKCYEYLNNELNKLQTTVTNGAVDSTAGVSAEYRKNGIYKQNIDALAKSKGLTKDVIGQKQFIRIGGARGADLNANALKMPFYNTIASLQQTRKVDAAWKEFTTAMKNSDAFSEVGFKPEAFVFQHPITETDLRKKFTDDIYKIVTTKFGVMNDFTGNLKLNDSFRKTLNQYISDSYNTVLGRKAAGEGIALAEVIDELNNSMPSLQLTKSSKYNDFMSTLSAYQNSGGSLEDLRATILVECLNLKDQGLLDTPEGRNLIGTIRILDEAAEGSERISNLSSEGKFSSVEDMQERYGDSVLGGTEETNPEEAMRAAQDEAERIAEEAPRDESLAQKVAREYSSDMNDVQRYQALKNTIEYLEKKGTKVTEDMTFGQMVSYNKDGFQAFHNQVEAPYKSISADFQKQVAEYNKAHPKRPIKLTDADTKLLNPPKKGLLEGMSDNQYLKLQRMYENNPGQETFKVGKKSYTRAELAEAFEIGQNGRGIINYYDPHKLKELIENKTKGKKIELSKESADALEKLTNTANIEFASGVHYNTFDDFKEAFTDNATKHTVNDNIIDMRTAIERNLASNKAERAPLISLGELAPASKMTDNVDYDYNTINVGGKDGNLEITLVPDYGTRGASEAASFFGESNNTAVGYHLDVVNGEGKHTQFPNFEALADSELLSDDFAGDSVGLKEYFEKETGNKIPQATDQGRDFTQHFGNRAEEQEPLQWTPKKRTLKQDYIEYKTIEEGIANQKEKFAEKYGVTPDEYRKDFSDVIEEKMSQEDFRKKYGDGKQAAKDYAHIYDLNETLDAKKKAFDKKSDEYEELGIPFEGMTEADAVLEAPNAKEVSRLRDNLQTKRNAINERFGEGRKARAFAEEFKDQYKNLPHEPKDIKSLISDNGIKTSEKTNDLLKKYEKSFKKGTQDIDTRNELKASLIEDAKNTWHGSKDNSQKLAKPDKGLSKEELAAYKKEAQSYNALLKNYKKAPSVSEASANPSASENPTLGDWMFTELNRHSEKPRYNEKKISALADKYSDKIAKAQTPEEIANISDEIAADLVPLDPTSETSATELKHASSDIQNAIFWAKQSASDTPSQTVSNASKNESRRTIGDKLDEEVAKFNATQEKEFSKTDNYRVPKNYETEVNGVKMSISANNFFGTEGRVPTLDVANEGLQRVNLSSYTESGKTGKAYKSFADNYSSLQESVLDFPGETSDLNMSVSESNLNSFLYGSKNGSTGHFDKMGELTTKLNDAKATADDIIDNGITDKLSSLKKLDGSSYEDIVEQLKAIKAEIHEAYSGSPDVAKALEKRIDDEIDFAKRQIKNDKQGLKRFIEHDADYRNITDAASEQANLKAGAGESMIHNINGTLIVGNDTTMPNRISLADLRTANEVVEIDVDKTHNPFKQESRRRQDKKVLKDMRKSFNDGYEIKGKISGNTQRQKEAWIDDIAAEVRERTGNPDLPESEIFVDKQMANLGQFYFKEGRQGWQERAYRIMSSLSDFNKTVQDFHLAGGVGQYNAFTLRNALTMMWQDPVGGTKALFTNFRNAKDNTSVMKYFVENHEKMLKYAIDSNDYSIINAFAPVISMDERLSGGGIVNGVINQVYGAKNTFKEALEKEGKFGALRSVPKGIYEEMFNNPTFARWTIIAKADMQMRNYAKAEKFVNNMMRRYNLTEEDFANMEGGMGGKDEYIATLARMRTDRYWNPSEFALSGFSTKKYLERQDNKIYKETFESLKGMPRQKTLNSIAGDFFFAVNYKLQMNAHPINGIGSMFAGVFTVPRASMAVRNGNLAPMAMRFAGRGDRTQAAVMIGIAALAHAWNTSIGAPSAWEELWGDHGDKENGTYGISQTLLNFQDFGKFWIPNDGNGGFDASQPAYSADPFFSIFTLQNSGMRGLNKLMNPNQVPINWQRSIGAGPISIATGQAPVMIDEPTSFGARLAGVADEIIGANLLAGYKAIYEVMNNSTYFGNNIWERKYLPDGTLNKNYNPVRNMIASVAHILNLDSVLEGKSPLESGTNRWVKGLTIEEGKGLQIGEAGVRQDKIGTVSGSGLLQHEYATSLGALQRGDYFDALTESMELPFKSRNYAARAKTALNQEVMLALRQELHKYNKAIEGASPDDKDKAYAEFANAAVNILHDWSAKYGNVLGTNDELTSSATKIAVSFLADEYNDSTSYVQNMYDHLRQELKMADGDQFLFSNEKMEQAIASGMSPEEAAATYNKHLTALKEAQIAEYEARKALIDAGINIDPDKNLFDSTDVLYADFEAKRATVNKKLLTEVRGKLESSVGEFKNYSEMKSYYESLIDEADTTKQKAKLANEYNKYVEDVIAPYLEEYGENILNSAYWDGDYVSNHLGKYLIIPADKTYKGKTPHSNYLKDEFGVGYRDTSNLPSDKETKEALLRASKALSTGRRASAKAIVDNALVQFRQGRIHASNEDREKLLRLRAMLSSRSN